MHVVALFRVEETTLDCLNPDKLTSEPINIVPAATLPHSRIIAL
jgi:hypothetical protein